jgi:hypothetical protein
MRIFRNPAATWAGCHPLTRHEWALKKLGEIIRFRHIFISPTVTILQLELREKVAIVYANNCEISRTANYLTLGITGATITEISYQI